MITLAKASDTRTDKNHRDDEVFDAVTWALYEVFKPESGGYDAAVSANVLSNRLLENDPNALKTTFRTLSR